MGRLDFDFDVEQLLSKYEEQIKKYEEQIKNYEGQIKNYSQMRKNDEKIIANLEQIIEIYKVKCKSMTDREKEEIYQKGVDAGAVFGYIDRCEEEMKREG